MSRNQSQHHQVHHRLLRARFVERLQDSVNDHNATTVTHHLANVLENLDGVVVTLTVQNPLQHVGVSVRGERVEVTATNYLAPIGHGALSQGRSGQHDFGQIEQDTAHAIVSFQNSLQQRPRPPPTSTTSSHGEKSYACTIVETAFVVPAFMALL